MILKTLTYCKSNWLGLMIILFVVFMLSCQKNKVDMPFSYESYHQDIDVMLVTNDLDSAQAYELKLYINQCLLEGDSLTNASYHDLLGELAQTKSKGTIQVR